MSLPGWALPTFAAAIVGLGLFGAYSYVDTSTTSASSPVIPVLLPDDKGPGQAQQPSEASTTPTSLPAHVGLPSSEGRISSVDPWVSEAMEAELGKSITIESNESDGAVEGSDFPRGVSGERASGAEGSAPLEGESSSLESVSPESTTASPRDPTQSSADPNTGALPQEEAPISTPPSDPPTSIQMPSPPSPPSAADASLLPRDGDAGTGRANDKLKQVLLVEDPRVLSDGLAMALKREPDLAVVGQTGSPADCGNFVSAEGEVDVAIVDLLLPDAQGLSLIEGLRRACPHVPLLVLTTSRDTADQERLMTAGANAVLAKDADPEQIAPIVRRLSPR